MAISDINKAMALYSQPSEFDQNAWKTAFDIANNFAITSENHRKNREMLNTEQWRTALMNNENQNKALSQEAIRQAYDFEAENRYDGTGRRLNNEEMRNLAWQSPQLNPYAKAAYDKGNVDFLTAMQQAFAPVNPFLASEYGVMAGNQNYLVNPDGTMTNFNTGTTIGTVADPMMIPYAAANGLWGAYQAKAKAEQEIAEAAAKAEARAAPQYGLIDYRAETNRRTFDYKQANKSSSGKQAQGNNGWSGVKGIIDEGAKGGKDTLLSTIRTVGDQYPHLRDEITRYGKSKLATLGDF